MLRRGSERPWPLSGNWEAVTRANQLYVAALALCAIVGITALSGDPPLTHVVVSVPIAVVGLALGASGAALSSEAVGRSCANYSVLCGPDLWDVESTTGP